MSEAPFTLDDLEFVLPDRLRKSLDVSGVSSGEMADHLGVSRNTISNWINGRTEPKELYVKVWAMRTGVPYGWLRTGEVKPRPDGPGGAQGLPRLDLNQQPFEKQSQQVTTLSRRLHLHHAA